MPGSGLLPLNPLQPCLAFSVPPGTASDCEGCPNPTIVCGADGTNISRCQGNRGMICVWTLPCSDPLQTSPFPELSPLQLQFLSWFASPCSWSLHCSSGTIPLCSRSHLLGRLPAQTHNKTQVTGRDSQNRAVLWQGFGP